VTCEKKLATIEHVLIIFIHRNLKPVANKKKENLTKEIHNKQYYHISHIVKVYFERRKIAKVFMTHMQDSF